MLQILRYLIQLILSPGHGWDDLAEESPDPDVLLRKGLYPLTILAAITEFVGVFFGLKAFSQALLSAILLLGTYFLSIFIGRLSFDIYFDAIPQYEVDTRRQDTLVVCGLGLMAFFQVLKNCLPWELVVFNFFPIFVVLILAKATSYMNIPRREDVKFILVTASVLVIIPLLIPYLINLFIG